MSKKVLCVCSCNELRSPTIAWVLSNEPWNYNTRSCGIDLFYALIPVTKVLLQWADEIVCANTEHVRYIERKFKKWNLDKRVICLGIPDTYEYRDEKLIQLVKERYTEKTKAF